MKIGKLSALCITSLVVGLFVLSSPARAVDINSIMSEADYNPANIGLYSKYVYRGIDSGAGGMSVQGDMGLTHDSGVSGSVWFATLGTSDATEFNFTLDYSADLGFASYSVGAIMYRYLNLGSANTNEIYAAFQHELGSVSAYYDTNSKSTWVDLSSRVELAEVGVRGTLGFDAPKGGKKEFTNLTIQVSKQIEVADVLMTPIFEYSYNFGKLNTVATPSLIVIAVNITY